ncbi:MAG: ThiF family adenylyltransferase [Brumimicrobium sp.]|nr:ThiF family adenylyltransferase [Brumimicrobium sp.]
MRSIDWEPIIFKSSESSDFTKLQDFIKQNSGIRILDQLESQIKELVKLRNPSVSTESDEFEEILGIFLSEIDVDRFGNWVYYPWNNNLVRILPEAEFIEVRTVRNRYKITEQEQNILRTKKVGVVGLSVGQSVSLALAMERIAGEIVIADFDHLELGNMNRIRTGLHNLGLPKTTIVAREIAEIDPYIRVKCFSAGLTRENMDSFFGSGEKHLDILVDECDSVDIKILAREKAKECGIPVLMDTSDRGMLDIERFDLDPDRPLFHGLVSEEDLIKLKGTINPAERVEIVGKIINMDTMSEVLRQSMKEIGKSITTWPQLGTDVMLGGAITGHMARKILLGKSKVSGRFFVDMEQIIHEQL